MSKSTRNTGKSWTPSDVSALRQLAAQNTPTRVIGLKLGRARTRIRRAHCAVGHVSRRHSRTRVGRVLGQRPRAGTHLRPGGKVQLVVGRG